MITKLANLVRKEIRYEMNYLQDGTNIENDYKSFDAVMHRILMTISIAMVAFVYPIFFYYMGVMIWRLIYE